MRMLWLGCSGGLKVNAGLMLLDPFLIIGTANTHDQMSCTSGGGNLEIGNGLSADNDPTLKPLPLSILTSFRV